MLALLLAINTLIDHPEINAARLISLARSFIQTSHLKSLMFPAMILHSFAASC